MEIEEGLTPSVRTDLTGAAGLRAVPPGGRTKRLPRGPASASRVPRGPVPRVGPPWDARHPGGSRRSSRGRRSGRGAAGALPPAWPNRSSGCRQPLLALARGGAGGLWVFGGKKKKKKETVRGHRAGKRPGSTGCAFLCLRPVPRFLATLAAPA